MSNKQSAAATTTYENCGTSDHYWRPMSPRCWHTALSHLGWTTPTHCWVARRPATSTDCRWHIIHLPELFVRHHVSLSLFLCPPGHVFVFL